MGLEAHFIRFYTILGPEPSLALSLIRQTSSRSVLVECLSHSLLTATHSQSLLKCMVVATLIGKPSVVIAGSTGRCHVQLVRTDSDIMWSSPRDLDIVMESGGAIFSKVTRTTQVATQPRRIPTCQHQFQGRCHVVRTTHERNEGESIVACDAALQTVSLHVLPTRAGKVRRNGSSRAALSKAGVGSSAHGHNGSDDETKEHGGDGARTTCCEGVCSVSPKSRPRNADFFLFDS